VFVYQKILSISLYDLKSVFVNVISTITITAIQIFLKENFFFRDIQLFFAIISLRKMERYDEK